MYNDFRPIPAAQLQQAYKLARTFGHEWAETIDLAASPHWSVELIRETVRMMTLGNAESPGGIIAPEYDGHNVHHTTGTGRLAWSVEPDGHVIFFVNRPQGRVLFSTVSPDGQILVRRESDGIEIFQRHVWALAEALKALVDETGVEEALAPIMAEAIPEPDLA